MDSPESAAPAAQAGTEAPPGLRLTLRIDNSGQHMLGPGKVRLLELIGRHGSISAAGRALGMSYRRAWLLVEALNQTFAEPVVSARPGGAGGGGAQLTPSGHAVIRSYRSIERLAAGAAEAELAALQAALASNKADAPAGAVDTGEPETAEPDTGEPEPGSPAGTG
jgi:molybdate transport system regulatory protein